MKTSEHLRHQKIDSLTARQTENSAGAAIAIWESMAEQIIAIVGNGGFNSLYARTVFLAQPTFPWLHAASSILQTNNRFAELKQCFEAQTPEQICAANTLLLHTFTDILSGLIGEQLTTIILRLAWDAEKPSPVPMNDAANKTGNVINLSLPPKE